MKRKFLAFLLLAALLLNAIPAYAAEGPTFLVETVNAEAGETVEITLWVNNNPGITSLKFSLEYDSALTLTGVTFNEVLGKYATRSPEGKYPVTLNWFDGMTDLADDFYFAKLTFTVAEDAASGLHAVSITYNENDVFNVEENNVNFAVVNGGVQIEEAEVVCTHENTTSTEAKEPTCVEDGNDAYTECDDCGQLFDENGQEIEEVPFRPATGIHTGGTATCVDLAVCATCGAPYGTYGMHDYSVQEKSDRTKTVGGTCADEALHFYVCAYCNEVEANFDHTFAGDKDPNNHTGGTVLVNMKDADHKNQINGYTGDEKCIGCGQILASGFGIPAGDHSAGTILFKDETGHWNTCAVDGCGVVMDKEAHTPDHDGGATEEYAVKCIECGYVIEAQLAHTHVFKEVADLAFLKTVATCENKAVYYKSCACGEIGNETFELGEALGHDWQAATCDAPKTCGRCGATEGEALGHKWQDATCEYPQTCSRCLETRGEPDGHNWEEATCLRPKTCSRCLKTEGEALGHKWIDATCTAPKTCEVCKRTDGEALGHKPDRAEATEEDAVKCTVCGETLIPVLDHTHKIEHVAESCYNTEYWFCEVCETYWADEELIIITNSKNVNKAVATHDLKHVAESCYNTEHWFCEACEIYWADEALTQITNSKNVIKATPSHKVEHVAESCYNEEYWVCEACDTVWADEALSQISNRKNVIKAVPSHELEYVAESCYNEEYWTCAICQTYWSDEALTQITNSKNVIKATPSHDLKHVEAVKGTCWVEGNIEHWYCEICNTVWADEALTQITNHKNVIVPAGHKVEHVAESCYNTEYWFCEGCETYWADEELIVITNSKNVIKAVPSHKIEHVAESCYNTEYWYCSICQTYWADEALTQITNSKNVIKAEPSHELVHVAESCYNTEYWFCEICEIYWADEALTQITNSKNVIKAEPSHKLNHVGESCYNTEHWFCSVCEIYWADEALTQITNSKNVIKATPSHELEHYEAVAPTCHDRGNVEYWHCLECGGYFLDEACTQLTNAMSIWLGENGSENLEHVARVEPTTETEGNVEYWYCPDCGRYFLDENCTQLTNAKNVIIAKVSNPVTGDSTLHFVCLAMLLSMMGVCTLLVTGKKRA